MPKDNKGNPHGEYSLGGFKGKGKGRTTKQRPSCDPKPGLIARLFGKKSK